MTFDTTLPCKKDDCLLYPLCIDKRETDCIAIVEYHNNHPEPKNVWRAILKVLPQLKVINGPFIKSNSGIKVRKFSIQKQPGRVVTITWNMDKKE